jgi:hypothetical protein
MLSSLIIPLAIVYLVAVCSSPLGNFVQHHKHAGSNKLDKSIGSSVNDGGSGLSLPHIINDDGINGTNCASTNNTCGCPMDYLSGCVDEVASCLAQAAEQTPVNWRSVFVCCHEFNYCTSSVFLFIIGCYFHLPPVLFGDVWKCASMQTMSLLHRM